MIKKILLVGIILCIGLGLWCSNHLVYNFNTDPLALSSKEQQEAYKTYQEAFKHYPDAITIGLEKTDVFNTLSDFKQLQSLTSAISKLTGVTKVESIETIKIPIRETVFVVDTDFLPLDSERRFQKKYENLSSYKDITQKFLSDDRTALSFYVFLDNTNTYNTIKTIRNLLENSRFDTFHILGAPAFEVEGSQVLEKETFLMTIIGCLLLLLSMFFFIPSTKRVGVTLLFTIFNVCTTLIFMYAFNIEITSFTSVIPCVIAIFSFTDILHILFHYDKATQLNTPEHLIKKQLFKVIGTPLILTSVSNLIGFLVFFFNGGISQITDLALAASFGIIFAFISSRFMLPQVLGFSRTDRLQKRFIAMETLISKCTLVISRYYKPIVFIFTIVMGLLVFAILTYSKINMYYYEKDNEAIAINKACAFYDDHFQGIRDIEVVIQTEDNNILNATTIKTIDTIESYLTTVYGCKTTFSINTIIKRFNRFRKSGNPDRYEIPEKLSASFFRKMKRKEDELGILSIISDDQKTTRIVGSLPDIGTDKAMRLNKELSTFLASLNIKNQHVFLNGKAFLFDQNVFNLTQFVLVTIAIGIFLIGIFTGFLFRSAWIGFTTFIANALPILFGVLLFHWFQVDLNPASVFMLTIIMGIALDDSIYILGHYYNSLKQHTQNKETLLKSLKTNSAPLLITSIVLSLSFLALSISSYESIFSFGIIMSLSLIFAFVSDLFFMPSLLYWGINKPLWNGNP